MGCAFSRGNDEDNQWAGEEKTVQRAEEFLNISTVSSHDFLAEFSKNRNGQGFSNQNQFLQAANTLGINTKDVTKDKTPICDFYSWFTISQGLYDTRKLCVLGVLLGKGSIDTKMNILFEIFDRDASGSIDYKEFKNMLQIIIEIALVQLPTLAINMTENAVLKRRLSKYVRRLSLVTKALVLYFRYLVHSDSKTDLSISELIEASEDPEVEIMFSASKLRGAGCEKYKSVIMNAKLVRNFFSNKKPTDPQFEFLDRENESDVDLDADECDPIEEAKEEEEVAI
jgi:hypothetical protein